MTNTPNSRRRVALLAGLAAVLIVPLTAVGISAAVSSTSSALDAQTVATAVFPGVPGDGSPAGHGPDSIEISSWSWGVSNSSSISSGKGGAGRGAGSGKVNVQDLSIMKVVDKATPVLFRACVAGKHYATVTLYLDEPSSAGSTGTPTYTTYMTLTLTNVLISSDTVSGGNSSSVTGGGEELPKESITLNFAKVTMTYSPQGAASTSVSWDGTIKG